MYLTAVEILCYLKSNPRIDVVASLIGESEAYVRLALSNFENRYGKCVEIDEFGKVALNRNGLFLADGMSSKVDALRYAVDSVAFRDEKYDVVSVSAGKSTCSNLLCSIIRGVRDEFPWMRFSIRVEEENFESIMHGSDFGLTVEPIVRGFDGDHDYCVSQFFDDYVGVYASGEYLDEFGDPKGLDDLKNHRVLVSSGGGLCFNSYIARMYTLLLRNSFDSTEVVRNPSEIFPDMTTLFRALKNGRGVAWLPGVFRPVQNGLKEILSDISFPSVSRCIVARRDFVDFMGPVWNRILFGFEKSFCTKEE